MEIQKQKDDIFAKIAALKSLTDNNRSEIDGAKAKSMQLWETLRTTSKDPINFLIDLIKELVGYESFKTVVSDTLVLYLDDIEDKIKYAIKLKLKELISCGVNPQIPDNLKYTGAGYQFNVNKIDYTNLFKLNPSSEFGSLLYSDIPSEINSTDANTFLFHTIQDDGNENLWGPQVGYDDIMALKFDSELSTETNILTVKASDFYSTNKKLTDWNNDYIDSIDLFPDAQFFAKMIDTVFNVFGKIIQKSQTESEVEEKINTIIDKLLDTEPDDIIDDSFFSFTNIELRKISEKARLKSLGISSLDYCYSLGNSTDQNVLLDSVNEISSISTLEEKKTIIDNSIDAFGSPTDIDLNENIDRKDKYNFRLNYFKELIKSLVKSIVSMILSPKMVLIFSINYKIVQGADATFDGIDALIIFLKSLFKEIIDTVKGQIVQLLLDLALTEVKKLQLDVSGDIQQELINNRRKILLSLVGVPSDLIKTISNF